MAKYKVGGNIATDYLRDATTQQLAFNENADFETWKKQIRDKFTELTGLDRIKKSVCPLNVDIVEEVECDGYKRIRFEFDSEESVAVPVYMLIPNTGKQKYPVAITLQGHSSGFHNSVGIAKSEKDKQYIETRGDFAVQAVKKGFIAVAIEQRGMGETKPLGNGWSRGAGVPQYEMLMCIYSAQELFMLGRTLIGERVWDISRTIDALSQFPQCDLDKILITGNSGGGTASYYGACYDERIKLCVPSCGVATYKMSLLDRFHCTCNFIPHAYRYFEMGDVSAMLSDRNLIMISGKDDYSFPIYSTTEAFNRIEAIFKKAGNEKNCKSIVTPKGHYWCKDIVWDAIMEKTTEMGWWK